MTVYVLVIDYPEREVAGVYSTLEAAQAEAGKYAPYAWIHDEPSEGEPPYWINMAADITEIVVDAPRLEWPEA